MSNRYRAGCVLFLALLASCQDNPGGANHATTAAPAVQQGVTLTTDSSGLVQTRTAKGTIVRLDDHFQNAVIARRNADGTVSTECHDDQQHADAFVQGATAPGTTVEVR